MCDDYKSNRCGPFIDTLKKINEGDTLPGYTALRSHYKAIVEDYNKDSLIDDTLLRKTELATVLTEKEDPSVPNYPLLHEKFDSDKVYAAINDTRITTEVSSNIPIFKKYFDDTFGMFGKLDLRVVKVLQALLNSFETSFQRFKTAEKARTKSLGEWKVGAVKELSRIQKLRPAELLEFCLRVGGQINEIVMELRRTSNAGGGGGGGGNVERLTIQLAEEIEAQKSTDALKTLGNLASAAKDEGVPGHKQLEETINLTIDMLIHIHSIVVIGRADLERLAGESIRAKQDSVNRLDGCRSPGHKGKCKEACFVHLFKSLSVCIIDDDLYIAYSSSLDVPRENNFIIGSMRIHRWDFRSITIVNEVTIENLLPYKVPTEAELKEASEVNAKVLAGEVDPAFRREIEEHAQKRKTHKLFSCHNGLYCSEPKLFTYLKRYEKRHHANIKRGAYSFGCIYLGSVGDGTGIYKYLMASPKATSEHVDLIRERLLLSYVMNHSGIFPAGLTPDEVQQYYRVFLLLMQPCIGCTMNFNDIINMKNDGKKVKYDKSDCVYITCKASKDDFTSYNSDLELISMSAKARDVAAGLEALRDEQFAVPPFFWGNRGGGRKKTRRPRKNRAKTRRRS